MRPRLLVPVCVLLAGGPTVIAFFSGGFFSDARLVALIVTWALVGVCAIVAPDPLPRGAGLLSAIGLALYTGWIALSAKWSSLPGQAGFDAERALLYLGAFVAAAAAFRTRPAARMLEVALAAGTVVVGVYGLLGRLLPRIVHESVTRAAAGRLEQPLTYWNAEGALAALGFVLCARVAGDTTRKPLTRKFAVAGAAPLGLVVYLTFSRGAVAALAGGLIVVLVLDPTRSQLRAVGIAAMSGVIAVAGAAAEHPVRDLVGSAGARQHAGATVLAVMGAAQLAAVIVIRHLIDREATGHRHSEPIRLPRRTGVVAGLLVVSLVVVPVLLARSTPSTAPGFGQTSARLSSLGSSRYAYWKVAVNAGLDHPLIGAGASGFADEWLLHRPFLEAAHDAHSLEIETFAELGLIGLALLCLIFTAMIVVMRTVLRADRALAVGPVAAISLWALHSTIDWDWEMPGLTLVAAILAGALAAQATQARRRTSIRSASAVTATAPSTTNTGSAATRSLVEP